MLSVFALTAAAVWSAIPPPPPAMRAIGSRFGAKSGAGIGHENENEQATKEVITDERLKQLMADVGLLNSKRDEIVNQNEYFLLSTEDRARFDAQQAVIYQQHKVGASGAEVGMSMGPNGACDAQ